MSTATTTPATPSSPAAASSGSAPQRRHKFRENVREFRRNVPGVIGLVALFAVVALALLAPLLVPRDTLDVTRVTASPNEPPTGAHLLGTDPLGRDVLGMLLWGSRISLLVGFTATVVSMVIGTSVGMLTGHLKGAGEWVMLRVIDFFLVIPSLVLAIVLSSVMPGGRGVWTIIIALGVTSWAGTARVVRSQTLAVEARPYIERARALGSSGSHIISYHVLPAVMPLVLANTTLAVGSAIISESTLSFLGLGDPTQISWGSMLKSALDTGSATAGYWWVVLPPGLAIVVVVLCFTLVGRALESVVNPTLRRR